MCLLIQSQPPTWSWWGTMKWHLGRHRWRKPKWWRWAIRIKGWNWGRENMIVRQERWGLERGKKCWWGQGKCCWLNESGWRWCTLGRGWSVETVLKSGVWLNRGCPPCRILKASEWVVVTVTVIIIVISMSRRYCCRLISMQSRHAKITFIHPPFKWSTAGLFLLWLFRTFICDLKHTNISAGGFKSTISIT